MGGLPRNDIVVFDSITASLMAITGVPNATPTDPTVPNTAVALARLRNLASATTIPTAQIDNLIVPTYLRGVVPPADTGWLAFTTIGGTFAGSTPTARKVDGWVTNRGTFSPAASGTLTSTFVGVGYLPAGCFPAVTIKCAVSVTVAMTVDCQIDTAGLVQIRTFSTAGTAYNTNTAFSLNGLTWRTD